MVALKDVRTKYRIGNIPQIATDILEADICRDIKAMLKTQRVFWRRIEGTAKLVHGKKGVAFARSETKGFPDFLICKDGKMFGAEIKKVRAGLLSSDQAECLSEMAKSGATAGVCTSATGVMAMIDAKPPSRFVDTDFGPIPIWD